MLQRERNSCCCGQSAIIKCILHVLTAVLKQEIQRLDRNKSREGVNLEYLKNIVYKYMTAPDAASRQSIFTAIATILHFSPQERKAASQKSL